MLDTYPSKSMVDYVALARSNPDAINLGLSPFEDGESVHLERNERDVMFYGKSGVKALGGVISGELLRMQQLTNQRMIIITPQPDQWRYKIESTLGQTNQVHVFDIRNIQERKKAAEIIRKPKTDAENVAGLRFTFVLDQIDILTDDRDLEQAIDKRAWRDYDNVTLLASVANVRKSEDYRDFASIVPVDDDPATDVFGVMLQPVNMPDDVHLVRIFS